MNNGIGVVDSLPERLRMPVWLHEVEGFSWDDVGRIVGIPVWLARLYGGIGRWRMGGQGWPADLSALRSPGAREPDAGVLERAPAALLARIGGLARRRCGGKAGAFRERPPEALEAMAPGGDGALWIDFAIRAIILVLAVALIRRWPPG